ncbi:MAG: alpha-(1-_3)-arabinofuranosyltransferase domain-containing protein, partial [Acidimicrobiales bacterium]
MQGTVTPVLAPVSASRPRHVLQAVGSRRKGVYGVAEHLVLAAVSFIPLLVVKPGVETSDTKTYLYLDPGRFLHQVASMWDPSVALGTVTHEYIGYLLPMGPFYWFFSAVGVPIWVAQRLWLGSILFAAGAGTLLLCRTLNLRAPGRTVAALAFMLSPYFLQYAGRISVILLPWAGLPFMVAFAARALRQGGWRYPALFALVVAVTSGINASSIIYVGVAPLLWIVFAVAVEREASWGEALATAIRITVLTVLTCLWWIVGLVVEAGYGVDVLKYTETLPATSETSSASEVIRGLGYWYFYGADRLGPWAQSAVQYTQQIWLLAVSYLVPVIAFVSAVVVRWRYRAYFILLVVSGVVLSVGAHPYSDPTPLGGLLKEFMLRTTAGLALRSTDRATPLVVLGLAML